MFDQLEKMARRPRPFEAMTTALLWTDEYVSKKMLEYHLNEEVDAASRNPGFIDRSAAWLISRFGLGPGSAVCDMGCGPGLYTSRLARSGTKVTGVDFSRRSLEHARSQAREEGLEIDYIHRNYLEFRTDRRFDLVTMIFCDFCALNPDQRSRLLGAFRELLKPGGAVVLDYFSPEFFSAFQEKASYKYLPPGGFWSPEPYHVFQFNHKYPDLRLTLSKYVIYEKDRTREIYNWLQCFSPESIEEEFRGAGFGTLEHYGDVAGGPPAPDSPEQALAAWKQS